MSPNLDADTKAAILSIIADHDGLWGWYQLDRALAQRGILGVHIPSAVSTLKNEGLIEFAGDPQSASVRYRITDAGKRYFLRSMSRFPLRF